MLQYRTTEAGQRNRAKVGWVLSLAFLELCRNVACFLVFWTVPVWRDLLKIRANFGARSLRIPLIAMMWSYLGHGLLFCNSFRKPTSLTANWFMLGKGSPSGSGMVESGSPCMNTDWYCLFRPCWTSVCYLLEVQYLLPLLAGILYNSRTSSVLVDGHFQRRLSQWYCLFWFFTSHQQSFRYKGMGLPGLNQY